MVQSVGNTTYNIYSREENPIVFGQTPRRIITHAAASCATAVEAETTELIENIVYRYFSTLGTRGDASTVRDNTSTSSGFADDDVSLLIRY